MAGHLRGIDHVIVGVGDLDAARAAFARLGFVTTPRGRHAGWGTANHCLMFPNDYVELLGRVDPTGPDAGLGRMLAQRGEGLLGLALASHDPAATEAAWRAAGLAPETPRRLARDLEDGSGTSLAFENVMLEPSRTSGLRVFASHALDPEALRRPEWLVHPNGAAGIGSITVVTGRPDALAGPFGAVFGEDALTATDDTLAIHTGHGLILVVTPDDFEMLHPELDPVAAASDPIPAALTLVVDDAGRTAAWLDGRGVPYRRSRIGAVGVAAAEACGVALEFVAAGLLPLRPALRI